MAPNVAQQAQTGITEASVNPSRGKRAGKGQNRPELAKKGKRGYEPHYSEYTNLVDTRENIYLATERAVHYRKPSPMFRGGEEPQRHQQTVRLSQRCRPHHRRMSAAQR